MKKRIFAFILFTCLIFLSSCGITDALLHRYNNYSTSAVNRFTWSEPEYEKIEPKQNADGEPLVILDYEVNIGDMYYRNLLDEKERMIYDFISDAISNFNPSVTIPKIDEASLFKVTKAYTLDHPESFHWRGDYHYYIFDSSETMRLDFVYVLEKNVAIKYQADVKEKAETAYLPYISADMTQYEASVIFHDLLIRNVSYSENPNSPIPEKHNIFGALINNDAVCSGYAQAFKYLCNRVGISVICVNGTSADEAHQWNIVTIGNKSFNADVTWDDPSFDDGSEMTSYQFFGATNNEFSKTHTPFTDFTLPDCNTSEYNYCEKYRLIINDENEIFDILSKAIALSLESKSAYSSGTYDIFLKINTGTCLYKDTCDIILKEFSNALGEVTSVCSDWELIYLMNDEIDPYVGFCLILN